MLAQAINTELLTAFGKVINTDANEQNSVAGSLAFTPSELTISSGSVTATRTYHTIDTESDAATDDLANITTGSVDDYCILIISAANTARTVVVKDAATGAGEIHMIDSADFSLDDTEKTLILQRRGTDWYEIGRTGVTAASQAQMEAATDTTTAATPGRAQYHPGVCKAWVNFDGTAVTGAADLTGVGASHNIASVVDNAVGDYSINIDTDFSGASYCSVGMAGAGNGVARYVLVDTDNVPTAGTLRVECRNDGTTTIDASEVNVAMFGDQ